MATRIDIELTSRQDDGQTFTWRAAGAREPKGSAAASLFPEGSKVGDEFKVETEMGLDGIEITAVVPAKEKKRKEIQTLELIGPENEPLVTQQLAPKGRRDDRRGGKKGRKGGRKSEGRDKGRGGDRPRTPAKPKLPPKPKPPRLKAGKAHRNALLDSLPEEQKAVAQEVLRGGMQAVRSGLDAQNDQRKKEGKDPIDPGPIVVLAEELLLKVRAAEWRDRAEAALEQAPTVDLRDLRSVVTAADGAAKDEETRALAAQLRNALSERLDHDHHAWVEEITEMLDDDRVVRALHLSSRPPKAGAPLPAPVAMRLVEAANAAMNAETSPDRWSYILDALAHSPVRRQVVPVSLPTTVTDELKQAIARHGSRLPEIAQIFGIEPDPSAGRERRGKGKRKGKKGDSSKGESKKDEAKPESTKDEPKPESTKDEPNEGAPAPVEASDHIPATEPAKAEADSPAPDTAPSVAEQQTDPTSD